jgi:hypothetical protein
VQATIEDKLCSFCGTPWNDTLRTIWGGHGAFICDACVDRFARLQATPEGIDGARGEPWRAMSDEELLRVLPSIVATANQVDAFLHDWVGVLRERKVSWQQIGMALGVSRQAVWERFTRPKRDGGKAVEQSS